MTNIRKLEATLWESADLLRAGSKLTSNQYCMPVLGLIFLRYAYSRYKKGEAEILKDRPVRKGRVLPVEKSDFTAKSALFLPKEAQYEFIVNLPGNVASAGVTKVDGQTLNSLGEVLNNAMELIEAQSPQLSGSLPKDYTAFSPSILSELLQIFNDEALNDVDGDVSELSFRSMMMASMARFSPRTMARTVPSTGATTTMRSSSLRQNSGVPIFTLSPSLTSSFGFSQRKSGGQT